VLVAVGGSGVLVSVGVVEDVGVRVLVGSDAAVWVKPDAKVKTACVWISSRLRVGVASADFAEQAPRMRLLIKVIKNSICMCFLVLIFVSFCQKWFVYLVFVFDLSNP
jgi:hypothetical protein